MIQSIFQFGELRPEFGVRVLNERAVRAGAGIVFFFAIVSFMNAVDAAEVERCRVPEFAKALGHEEKWKLHNHCR